MAPLVGSLQTDGLSAVAEANEDSEGRPLFKKEHYDTVPVDSRGAIRILKVYAGSSEQVDVLCELITGTILDYEDCQKQDPPLAFKPYDALSWCWGKGPLDGKISIRMGGIRYMMSAQASLVAALRAFRHETLDRHIWVDAVCINQEDKTEKNHQVEMMADIYGKADCVRIWLGGSDASSDSAILFIKKQVLQLHHFDDLCRSNKFSDMWKALLELMQREWFSRRWVVQEVALAPKAIIHCGKAKLSWTKFAVAVELFVEVETATHRLSEVMKTDTKYNHVPRWFEYISQLGASLLVDATGKLFRDYDYVRQLKSQPKQPKSEPKTAPRRLPDELTDESEDDELVAPEVRDTQYKKKMEARYKQKQGTQEAMAMAKPQPLLTLEYLVSNLSIFNVTNPHDSVYALLGIAKDTTPTAANKKLRVMDHTQAVLEMFTAKKQYNVDYKASYIDVCRDFIEFCVRRNVSRDPSRALDVICRPFAIDVGQKPDELPLPSWIPRLSKASYGMDLGPGIDGQRMGRKNADSLVGLPNLTHRNYNAAETKSLEKKVFRFRKRVSGEGNEKAADVEKSGQPATLQSASFTPQENSSQEESAEASPVSNGQANSWPADHSQSKSSSQNSKASLNHFSLFVKGFVLDTIVELQPSSQSGSIPTAWAHFAGWGEMQGTPPEHFWRTLVADRGSDGKNPPVYYSRACQESFRKGNTTSGVVDTTGLIEHERNSVVAQFCRRVQAAIWNRALVMTKAGRLGLVAADVKKDDRVCILYGCSVPVVLRRHGPKEQQVIQDEMEWELKFLANYVGESYKKHLERRKLFKEKRDKDKITYKKWEDEKRKQWKKDTIWAKRWELVRADLMRIHEIRAWVMKKKVLELEKVKDSKAVKVATIESLRNYVHVQLSQIYEIASGVSESGGRNENVMDQMRSLNNGEKRPGAFKLTQDQAILWDEFQNDTEWRVWWKETGDKYLKAEGFCVWSRVHKRCTVFFEENKKKNKKEWEERPAQDWTTKWETEWALENSWFFCIDSFRAWLRESGKFYGPEEVLNKKQEWEIDDEWHRTWDKNKSEIESFNAWIRKKDLGNPDLQESKIEEANTRFEKWRKDWVSGHPKAHQQERRKAEDIQWMKIEKELGQWEKEEFEKRKNKAQKRDKEPFLERWRKGWKPETINWKEFETALKYGRRWLKLVKRQKRDYAKKREQEWVEPGEVKSRQLARTEYWKRNKGDLAILYPNWASKTTAFDGEDTGATPIHTPPGSSDPSAGTIDDNSNTGNKPSQRTDSAIDLRTSKEMNKKENEFGEKAEENGKEIEQSKAKKKDHRGIRQRKKLTEKEKEEYGQKIEANFKRKMGEDGQWYYEMMGECYVHGMMDGEAMAHQNNEGIPTTVFEIR